MIQSRKKSKKKPIRLSVSRSHKPDDLSLEDWQRILRKQYGVQQKFILKNNGGHTIFSDFSLTNPESGKTYKIAIRGNKTGDNHCTCPDYSINNLGTCKHIEFVLSRLMKKPGAKKAFRQGYTPPYSEIYLNYDLKRRVRFKAGRDAPPELLDVSKNFFKPDGFLKDKHILDFPEFLQSIPKNNGHEVRCYDDVLAYIAEHQDAEHRRKIIQSQLREGSESPVFKNVLRTKLYPYQREGAFFAVKAGRCLIGDDMGLGKTIQALAAAEVMARLFHIQKALIDAAIRYHYQTKNFSK